MMVPQIFLVLSFLTKPCIVSCVTSPQNNSTDTVMPKDDDEDKVSGDIYDMRELFEDLLDDYDTRIRPVVNQSRAVNVSTEFIPMSLLELDTMGQKFSVLAYFRISWKDEILTWKEDEYANTNNVKIPIKEIWTPTLIISKTVNGDGMVGNMDKDSVKVSSNGDVQWVPEGIYSVVCDVSIKYYPFDEQICRITYYVSDETITRVYLSHKKDVTLDRFSENAGWTMKKVVKKQFMKYNSNFIDIEFHMQRRAGFTTFTLIMPLLMLAFLNTCIFLVPIGSGEKGSFAITIFLSYGIFSTIISNTLPQNSLQVSYFVVFITILLFLSVFSVFYTVLQAKLVASVGDKHCTWKFLTPKLSQRSESNTNYENGSIVKPGTLSAESGETSAVSEPYTWTDVLGRIDTIIFVLFLVAVAACTVTLFVLMLQG